MRASGPENFQSLAKKDFFNTIRHKQPLAPSQLLDPKVTLTARFNRPLQLAREQNNSSFRAQGRLDALDQPLPHVRPAPPNRRNTRTTGK